MIYLILGLPLGSLYAVVMGSKTLDSPQAPVSIDSFHIVALVIGMAILGGLEFVKRRCLIKCLNRLHNRLISGGKYMFTRSKDGKIWETCILNFMILGLTYILREHDS